MSYNYDRTKKASVRLDSRTKNAVNKDLARKGMDGNGRFRKPGEALAVAAEILEQHGLEFMDPFTQIRGSEGHSAAHILMDGDTVGNTMFAYQWTEVGPGRYEVTAYLS